MAAFERVLSGIPEMDRALDSIRLGDNVVWQVTKLEEFRLFLDPYSVAYYQMPYKDKAKVARTVGVVNRYFRDSGKHLMLLVPGRIGTSSPELGVPTAFSDISGFDIICEVSESRVGYLPELSYGSHIFQDLVESDILYTAVFENEKTLAFVPEILKRLDNCLTDYYPEGEELKDIVGIYSVEDRESFVYHDMKTEHLLCLMEDM